MAKLPQELIDHICEYLPLEESWKFSHYTTIKKYNPDIHDDLYWVKIESIDALQFLLENSIINKINISNLFMRSCSHKRIDILKLLTKFGYKNEDGELNKYFPYWAGHNDKLDLIKYLLENNIVSMKNDRFSIFSAYCNYNYYSSNNYKNVINALDMKHMQNMKNMVKLLLKHGCDLKLGENADVILFAAVYDNNTEMTKLFLEYGADHTIKDNFILKNAKRDILHILLKHLCKI